MTIHILATGTSRGIGRAIATAFDQDDVVLVGHASGASGVAAADRHDERTRPDGSAGADGAGATIVADLDQADAAGALWDAALARLDGRIDVLINNAGIFEAMPLDAPEAEWVAGWERTMRINLTASAELCRRAILHWQARGSGGRIVNVASRAAYRGDSPAHWHYAASKAGMVAMTKTIARGYAREDILAFAVCPGFTMTGMAQEYLAGRGGDALLTDIPIGRVAQPDEIATTVRFLALDAPGSMTGAILDINGASYVR